MEETKFSNHPIQLVHLKVTKLFIEPNLEVSQDLETNTGNFSLVTGHSKYNEDDKIITVSTGAQISSENGANSFDLDIQLLGIFEVDEERFPLIHIEDWAERNAPIILYPYVREHVYSLTTRCGYTGALLPLLEVPTFKIEK